MVDYSAVLEELKENLTAATPETQQMHWDNAKRALMAVTDGRTKENYYAKLTLFGVTIFATSLASTWYQLHRQKKFYDKRDQAWRQTVDSAMRIVDILQEPGLTQEDIEKKVNEELDFIAIIKREQLKEK